jgi:hypothetical protein
MQNDVRLASRHVTLLVAALCGAAAARGDPEFAWVTQVGGAGEDRAAATATDAWDDVVFVGSFEGSIDLAGPTRLTSSGSKDMFVAKTSPGGTLLWARSFGGAGDDFVNAVAVDASRNIYLAGSFRADLEVAGSSLTASAGGAFFAKLAPDGTPLWIRQAGTPNSGATAIAVNSLGDIVVGGTFSSFTDERARFGSVTLIPANRGPADTIVARYSPDGSRVRWVKHLYGDVNNTIVRGVAVDRANDIFVSGTMYVGIIGEGVRLFPPPGRESYEVFVLKLDGRSGDVLAARAASGVDGDFAHAITLDGAGNALVTGFVRRCQ